MAVDPQELEQLSSAELRRRAFHRAAHHGDVKFFWQVLKMIPAAEEAEGAPEELSTDVDHTRGWIDEYLHPNSEMEDAMRPIFIDYLAKHG